MRLKTEAFFTGRCPRQDRGKVPIDPVDGGALVVAAQKEEVLRVFNFVGEQ